MEEKDKKLLQFNVKQILLECFPPPHRLELCVALGSQTAVLTRFLSWISTKLIRRRRVEGRGWMSGEPAEFSINSASKIYN